MVDDVETDDDMKGINYEDINSENSEKNEENEDADAGPALAKQSTVKARIDMIMNTQTPQEYYQE